MVCPKCSGKGKTLDQYIHYSVADWCTECQGSGIVSCCDTAGASNVIDLGDAKWDRALRGAGLMQLSDGRWVDPKSVGYIENWIDPKVYSILSGDDS